MQHSARSVFKQHRLGFRDNIQAGWLWPNSPPGPRCGGIIVVMHQLWTCTQAMGICRSVRLSVNPRLIFPRPGTARHRSRRSPTYGGHRALRCQSPKNSMKQSLAAVPGHSPLAGCHLTSARRSKHPSHQVGGGAPSSLWWGRRFWLPGLIQDCRSSSRSTARAQVRDLPGFP